MTETTPGRAAQALGLDANAAQGKELTPLDRRIAKTRTMESRFADAVAVGLSPQTLIGDAITALRTVPKLQETTEASFFGALMTAAQLGLRPNVATTGHGWVLPFWNGRKQCNEAQWIIGYQGMVELAFRSGMVASITAKTIYQNEHWEVDFGLDEKLVHVPNLDPANRGEAVAHYAIVRMLNGGRVWHVMGEGEIEGIAAKAIQKSGNSSPWLSDRSAMARKTVLRALWRFMPKTPALALALATDETVRDGMEKDATVQHPDADTVTITRATPPEPDTAAPSAPQADEPVDAQVVSERTAQRNTAARTAAFRGAAEKHGPRLHDAMHAVVGERVDDQTWTQAELAAALDVDLDAWDNAQLDAAAADDGA